MSVLSVVLARRVAAFHLGLDPDVEPDVGHPVVLDVADDRDAHPRRLGMHRSQPPLGRRPTHVHDETGGLRDGERCRAARPDLGDDLVDRFECLTQPSIDHDPTLRVAACPVTVQLRQSRSMAPYNPPVLIGRQEELRELSDRMRGDRPVAVLGEAGIGKSALVRHAVAAADRPARVGGALASLQWLDHLPLARALGTRRLSGDAASVASRVRDALRADALLVVEDLQWADPATLEVLGLLMPAPIVVTVRTGDPDGDGLTPTLAAWGMDTMTLPPLDEAEAESIVRDRLPMASSVAVARIVRRCGGNPLLLTQLTTPDGEAAESLRLALAARLRDASRGAVETFRLLATLGRPVHADRLDRRAVAELEGRRLVEHGSDGVVPSHQVLGALALGTATETERRELHRRAAHIADDPGERAFHLEKAGDRADAYVLARAAADAAEGPGERAAHLGIAARCALNEAAETRLEAATALVGALRNAEALAVLDGLVPGDPAMHVEAAILRSRAAWYAGDDEAFRASVETAVREAAAAPPGLRARAMVERARQAIFLGDDEGPGAIARAEAALALVRESGVPAARAEMMAGLAHYMADSPAWSQHLEVGLAEARAAGDLDTELLVANNLITAHESSGDPRRGAAIADEMIERARAAGLEGWALQLRAMRANLDLHQGAYAATIRIAGELLDEPIDRRMRAQVEATLAVALTDVGRGELAVARLDELHARPGENLMAPSTDLWLRAEAALHEGRARHALDRAQEAIAVGMEDPFAAIVACWARFDLGSRSVEAVESPAMPMFRGVGPETAAVAALACGDLGTAVDRFDEAATAWRPYHRRGELRCRWGAAEALRRRGDVDAAVERLLELELELEGRGMAPLLARARRSLRSSGFRRSAIRKARRDDRLTDREREIMLLVATGLTNGEIGRRLGISRSTVTEHVARAMETLGVTSRAQACALIAS